MTRKTAHAAYLNLGDITEELYQSIVDSAYSYAVQISKNITAANHGFIITDVAKRLAQENNKNLLSYIYQLWNGTEEKIVRDYLPSPFPVIFGQGNVILQNQVSGSSLAFKVNDNDDGERSSEVLTGNKNRNRVTWKIYPYWENNNVFFKIKNVATGMYLSLRSTVDRDGSRSAIGISTDSNEHIKHSWFLQPDVIDGEYLFHIVNRQFGVTLQINEGRESYAVSKKFPLFVKHEKEEK